MLNWKELTISKHDNAVDCTDSSTSSNNANITPRTWVVYCRIWITGICNFKGSTEVNYSNLYKKRKNANA